MADEVKVEVFTAREALFEIRRVVREANREPATPTRSLADVASTAFAQVERVAEEGLARNLLVNFELSDQLADRLAEAHKVLREWDQEGSPDNADLEGRTSEALALPPDIEAMIERRL